MLIDALRTRRDLAAELTTYIGVFMQSIKQAADPLLRDAIVSRLVDRPINEIRNMARNPESFNAALTVALEDVSGLPYLIPSGDAMMVDLSNADPAEIKGASAAAAAAAAAGAAASSA